MGILLGIRFFVNRKNRETIGVFVWQLRKTSRIEAPFVDIRLVLSYNTPTMWLAFLTGEEKRKERRTRHLYGVLIRSMSEFAEKKENPLTVGSDSKINVVVNRTSDEDDAVSLLHVLGFMKKRAGFFVWVIALFVVVGVCLPLIISQLSKESLRAVSVVTLDYDVVDTTNPRITPTPRPVTDLTAPDGTPLDLSGLTSAYVLQSALDGLTLSEELTVAVLRDNIHVDRILTEDSRRQQEVASKMLADKNGAAYSQLQSVKLTYVNQFVVSIDNGFSTDLDNEKKKVYLRDDELRLLLNRILESYDSYLAMTYADLKIPGDEIGVIDTEGLDIMESLDLLQASVNGLYAFCDAQPDAVKDYRSYRDGRSLRDLMETLQTVSDVNVNYLSSHVYANSIAKDTDAMLSKYRYTLRETESKLDVVKDTIATTKEMIAAYKPDRILLSSQENDSVRTTYVTTDYYNQLMISQAENYQKAAELEVEINTIKEKIANLEKGSTNGKAEQAKAELAEAVKTCHDVYVSVREQMEEIMGSAFYTRYADASAAQGKQESFLTANAKGMVIGAVLGALLACGWWFVNAFAAEMKRSGKKETGEEVAA